MRCKFVKMSPKKRTEARPVLLGFSNLQFFYLHLFSGFWSAFPPFRAFLFEVLVVSREPDVPDDQVKFIEGQFALWRQRRVEEPKHIDWKHHSQVREPPMPNKTFGEKRWPHPATPVYVIVSGQETRAWTCGYASAQVGQPFEIGGERVSPFVFWSRRTRLWSKTFSRVPLTSDGDCRRCHQRYLPVPQRSALSCYRGFP